jgi:hypothetical protein
LTPQQADLKGGVLHDFLSGRPDVGHSRCRYSLSLNSAANRFSLLREELTRAAAGGIARSPDPARTGAGRRACLFSLQTEIKGRDHASIDSG